MARTIIVPYTINLPDPVQVANVNDDPAVNPLAGSIGHTPINSSLLDGTWKKFPALFDIAWRAVTPGGQAAVVGAPALAAALFNAPVITTTDQFVSPSITSEWITAGNAGPGLRIDTSKDQFQPDLGIAGDPNADDIWIWIGTVVYAAPNQVQATNPSAARGAISQVVWADGFELPEQGGGGTSGGIALNYCRAASRHADGYGLQMRGIAGVQYGKKTHNVDEFWGAARASTWERIYIKLVALPNADQRFWRARGSSGAAGIGLKVRPTGTILLVSYDGSSAETNQGTFGPLTVGKTYKIDILHGWQGASDMTPGQAIIYVNAVQTLSAAAVPTTTTHKSSEVGGDTDLGDTGCGVDFDDWIAKTVPAVTQLLAGATLTPAPDWAGGSKVRRVDVETFDADNAFAGDPGVLPQTPVEAGTATVTSSTSGALLTGKTNSKQALDDEPGAAGCDGFVVSKYGTIAAPGNGDLGYAIAGGADVDAAITESNVANVWSSVLYHPAGMFTANPVSPIRVKYTKAANTNLSTVVGLAIEASLFGTFGDEDVIPPATGKTPKAKTGNTGIHNSPYPRSPWAIAGPAPLSPVQFFAGTYVGNGVGLDLEFESPICFIFVRHAGGTGNGVEGAWWWSSMNANHRGPRLACDPAFGSLVELDPSFVLGADTNVSHVSSTLRITGSQSQINQNGETYQYVAIADPGMRFFLGLQAAYPFGLADRLTTLVNPNFLAEALFAFQDLQSTSTGTGALAKGIGHGTSEISNFNAAVTSAAIAVARGSITTKAALNYQGMSNQALAFFLMRRADGNADPGQNAVVQFATYVGDGTSARNIALLNASGKRPLLAFVVPHDNSGAFFRDPSHTGTNSTHSPATNNTATGIIGGDIDTLIVDTAANANGVTYDVIVFPGSDVAGNGGFSGNGTFEPVQPAQPVDGPFTPKPSFDISAALASIAGSNANAGGVAGGADFGTQCLAASTRVINTALSFIGVTQPVVDPTTDNTPESIQASLHYQDTVEQVLRDFPWPFATAYVRLALLAGSPTAPVNNDWVYSFGMPSDCVYARRLCRDELQGDARRFDRNPPAFRPGNDATAGRIIFTNYGPIPDGGTVAAPELEYTFRPGCAASAGDAMFRDALAWLLASKLAPGLSRNKVTAADALKVYDYKLSLARRAAANEAQARRNEGEASWIDGRN